MAGPRIVLNNGGRVTSRDPSMLGEGELAIAKDAYYKPSNPAIWQIPGRSEAIAASSGPVKGLRWLEYDGASIDVVLGAVGTTYRETVLTITDGLITGTFADVVTGLLGGDTLDSVQYANNHYLLNGVDRNRRRHSDGTFNFHGMLVNAESPSVTDDGAGAGYTLAAGATMTFWIEEQVRDTDNVTILRRNADDGDTTVVLTGTGASITPRIFKPGTVNSDATHWEAYATGANGVHPAGASLGEAVIGTAFIDDVRTSSAFPTGTLYPTVAVTLNGLLTTVAKFRQPPIATTGDVFENSLVLNDVDNPRRVAYSFTDQVDAFPATHLFIFDTKEHDEVRVIRTLGETGVVVLLRDSAWRINTLPTPDDSAFSPERVRSEIDGAYGCVGAMAADTFSFGDGLRLAYVSPYGLVVTDGARWDVLTDDVDWEAEVDTRFLNKIILRNNPSKYRLEMVYVPVGAASETDTRTMLLHYHPSHAKQSAAGGLRAKVTWPVSRDAEAHTRINLNGFDHMLSGHNDGKVYQNDAPQAGDDSGLTIELDTLSGDIYANFVGGHTRVKRTFVHHSAAIGEVGQLVAISRGSKKPSQDITKNISLDLREATALYREYSGEAVSLGFRHRAIAGPFKEIGVNFFALDLMPLGAAETR